MEQQDGAAGVATVAKEQAGQVGRTAADAGGQVAQTTKEQAQNVVGEAKQQARDLVGEARTQVQDQAGTQKGRAVEGLRSLGDELHGMSSQDGASGLATEVARQAAQRAHGLADHLDRHEPAELLDQVRSYARRRPVVFLAGAAVVGILAGRMTRNLASKEDDGPARLTGSDYPAVAPGAGYQPAYQESVGYQEPVAYQQPVSYQEPAVYQEPVTYQEPVSYDPTYQPPGTTPAYGTPGSDPNWRQP